VTKDFAQLCNVRSNCRATALYGVQGPGYGRCACEKHKAKAEEQAEKARRGAVLTPDAVVKVWRLAYFEAPGATEQLELPLEGP
jgi:hypothetical protein